MTEDQVAVLPDDTFTRVLCVVAHPDDLEYGTSAAIAKWVEQGVEVGYLLLTRGEAGMPTPPQHTAAIRRSEQEAACRAVGVKHLRMLEHPDGVLVYSVDLRADIAREIRRFQPDVVLTTNFDVEAPWGLNQADHRAAGLATIDAVRDAGNRWVFPDQIVGEGLTVCSPNWLLIAADANPTHGVEVSPVHVAKSISSLECHAEYLAALPWHPAPSAMISEAASMGGQMMGLDAAVLFRAHRL